MNFVALLAEGVDRNDMTQSTMNCTALSPSSRRAWIEIEDGRVEEAVLTGRPPRGGRG